jgi:hypothetical protein
MSHQAVLSTAGEEASLGLEADVRTVLEAMDLSPAAYFYGEFNDHHALGEAIRQAIAETAGTDASFEDGVRKTWSPTRIEEWAFARFLTEFEAAFWMARKELLRPRRDAVGGRAGHGLRSFLEILDREIRQAILSRIEAAALPAPAAE